MGYTVFKQNKSEYNVLLKDIEGSIYHNGQVLNEQQLKRIKFYTIQSTIVNKWFATLRGSKIAEEEKRYALYLGALTPLFDDLTDSGSYNAKAILTAWDKRSNDNSSTEIVAGRYLYNKLLENTNPGFVTCSARVLEAQDESMQQMKPAPLSFSSLKTITFKKGAASTMLGRSILLHPLLAGEEEAICQLGYLLQLTNDVFDVHKDYTGNQQTMVTNSDNISTLFDEYKQGWKEVTSKFFNLDYDQKNVTKFLLQVSTILARGYIAFEQLLQCQLRTGNQFNPSLYKRKELICDMEKPVNLKRSIKITANYFERIRKGIFGVNGI
ncbi:hypothetical protein BH20BAC1_BH20BAC1_09390 [soil metagenome]